MHNQHTIFFQNKINKQITIFLKWFLIEIVILSLAQAFVDCYCYIDFSSFNLKTQKKVLNVVVQECVVIFNLMLSFFLLIMFVFCSFYRRIMIKQKKNGNIARTCIMSKDIIQFVNIISIRLN